MYLLLRKGDEEFEVHELYQSSLYINRQRDLANCFYTRARYDEKAADPRSVNACWKLNIDTPGSTRGKQANPSSFPFQTLSKSAPRRIIISESAREHSRGFLQQSSTCTKAALDSALRRDHLMEISHSILEG